MAFDFKTQNKIGKKGESLLKKSWDLPIRKLAGKGPDFIDLKGNLIELKTDTYEVEKTPFFFIERWSVCPTTERYGKAGGPWQSLHKGSTVFVYLFISSGVYYVFRDIPALVERLESLIWGARYIAVPNRGFTTIGYRVLREELEDLYEEVQI